MENETPKINCKYYSSEEFIWNFSKSKYLSSFHLNISSLTKHFHELQDLLAILDINFSLIGITETKFSRDVQPPFNYTLPNYSVEQTPSDSSAGILLYISNLLTYKPRKNLNLLCSKVWNLNLPSLKFLRLYL